MFMAGLCGMSVRASRDRALELLSVAGLGDHAQQLAGNLSGGQRRRLELAMGMVHLPAVLFLDEPTLGLDITARRSLWEYLADIRRRGITIVLATHYLDEADMLCDRVAIIAHGRVRSISAPAELKRRFAVASLDEAFLAVTGQAPPSQPPADQLVRA